MHPFLYSYTAPALSLARAQSGSSQEHTRETDSHLIRDDMENGKEKGQVIAY